jgi:energy-coupling factor transporter ATP-binding protein EcfA2
VSQNPSRDRPAGTSGSSVRLPGVVSPVGQGALVEVRDLSWRPFGRREPVLAGISLRIEAGSRVLLAGPSGSGKSTLLRALAGVLTTTETGDLTGSVRVDGSPPGRSSVGLMMQDPTDARVAGRVGRDVAFGPESFGMPRDQIWSRVRSALASVGFPYGEDHDTAALSGGECQRLALAGVLALRPRLVLLDEPTSMLDPSAAAVVRQAIGSAVRASGATLVVVEHRLSAWVGEVDRLVVLDPAGRVTADGPVAATLASSAESLAAQGVWVPGVAAPRPLAVPRALCAPHLPDRPPSDHIGAGGPGGRVLVSARSVSVTRNARASVMSANRPVTAVQALLDVSAAVSTGECVAVVGPSGAGKSTLTSLLAGVDEPSQGLVRAGPALPPGGALAIHRWASRALAARFGWVPQQAEHAVVARTVRGDVLSTSRLLGLDEGAARARADGLLEVLGLSALSGADPHHLSGGEQRRLALAGAIAHGPSVLVLDEPSVGQDRLTWSAVAGVIAAAREAGIGVVVATHDPQLIDLADRRISLKAGRLEDAEHPPVDGARAGRSEAGERPAVDHRTLAPGPRSSRRIDGRWSGLAGRSGPLSLLLASVVLVVGAPFISDLRIALIAFGVEIALAPVVLGIGRPPWRRLLPGLLALASVSFSNWLLSPGHHLSAGALAGLRVAFFVVPGALLVSRIDPSALGDHLGQRLRLPARPVVAAVAALYRFESLGEQWDQLARVRRVRGLGAGRSPLSRGRQVAALTFGLLIQTLRQAGRMAVAMEARGFSATTFSVPASARPAGSVLPTAAAAATRSVPSASSASSAAAASSNTAASSAAAASSNAPAFPGPSAVPVTAASSTTSLVSRTSRRPRRTWAEPAPWLTTDSLLLALGLAVAAIPMLLSVL